MFNVVLRELAISVTRWLPSSLKQWIHHNRALDGLARKAFATAVRAGGDIAVIDAGPMRGLKLALGEHVSHAHIRGTYEVDTLAAVDRLVQPGMVCYDLGASIGYVTLLMARKAKQVVAFEPAPHAIEEMKRQLAANNFTNVTIVPLPVSDSERPVEFAVTDTAYGSRINANNDGKWKMLRFTATTLDKVITTQPLPDFVKIDVEDEEGRVLAGAAKLLAGKKPLICCELHSVESARTVKRILEENGYRVENLDGQPFTVPPEVVPGALQVVGRPISR